MVTASTKKLRDWIAIALLAYVGVRLLLSLIALLTADTGFGVGFAEKSYLVVGSFTSVTPVLLVGGAVLIVTHLGEPSALARVLTLVALIELGLTLLLGLVTWIAALTTDDGTQLGTLGGVPLGGKAIGSIDTIVAFGLVGLALYFCIVTFNALPKPVRQAPAWGGGQPGWGPPPGQGGQQGGQQGWGPPQLQQPQPQQQTWGQPDHGQGDRSQAAAPPQGWGSSPDPWGQPQGQAQGQAQQAPGQAGQPSSPWESERRPEPGSYDTQPGSYETQPGSYETQPGSYETQSASYGQAQADPQPEPYPAGTSSAWGRPEDTGRESGQDAGPSWSEPQGEGSADSSSSWGQPSWGEPVQSQEYGTPRPADPEPEREPEREPEHTPEAPTSWQPDAPAEPDPLGAWQPEPQGVAEQTPEPNQDPYPAPHRDDADGFAEPEPADRTAQFEAVPAADAPERQDTPSEPSPTDEARSEESDREDGGSSGWWNPGQR